MSAEEHLVPAHGHDQYLDSCDKEQVHVRGIPCSIIIVYTCIIIKFRVCPVK